MRDGILGTADLIATAASLGTSIGLKGAFVAAKEALAANKAAAAVRGSTAAARETGKIGEKVVRDAYNIREKKSIQVGGQTRLPDGLSTTTLSEIKNVERQGLTAQLKDYLEYAEKNGLKMDLYVRENTDISKNLQDLIDAGRINLERAIK